ncbi:alpha/beta hydrolase fold domain-containing protein [Allorhizobium pseudoryzae]|uniref:alpha/beta hydrolase fold domain-containing protein n=1 Tax=Allorhizobium pseudoryzae TaxID=379684 RepID=UPI003CFD4358
MARQWQFPEDHERSFPLPFRVYEGKAETRKQPLVLYFRGHAFAAADRSEEDSSAALALSDAGAFVVEADYSGPSGNIFPRTLECGFGALKYLVAKRNRFAAARSPLLLAGDEAGGNLAASLALKARDALRDELAGQVLLSPMIDPRMATASFNRADGISMRTRWSDGWNHYLATACGYQHPYAAPCLCSRLTGVAPALIVTSDDDPLRDETLDYAARLAAADVPVTTRILPESCGWTGIYSGRDGTWRAEVSVEFSRFLKELPT